MSIKISGFQVGAAPPPVGIPQYGTLPTYYAALDGQNDGGSGLVQVSWAAPAATTAIAFVTSDSSGGSTDGYMLEQDGWSGVQNVQNNGANWWEYIWVSIIQNASTVSSAIATGVNFLQGRSIAIVESLNGIGGISPTTVGTYNSTAQTSSSANLFNYALNNTEFAVLCAGVEGHNYTGGNITSITSSSGLIWTKKSAKSNYNSGGNGGNVPLFQTCDIWYAKNNTGSDISNDTITINYAGSFDDQSIAVTNFGGVDFTNPWAS